VSGDLFDDDFQKKLETLAIVSRRVFAGPWWSTCGG